MYENNKWRKYSVQIQYSSPSPFWQNKIIGAE